MNQEQSKGNEKQMIDLLCSKETADPSIINKISFSTLISPADLAKLLQNHNTLLQNITDIEEEQQKSFQENEDLKQSLEKALKNEQPNIQEIISKEVNKNIEKQGKKHKEEKEQLQKDLHNRIDKVIKLELQLEEVKDAYK